MLRFAANLTMMFAERPFMERFAAARAAGFHAVEYLFPYDFDAGELKRALDDAGLRQVLFNAPPGDWTAGERGTAALPGRETDFREGIKSAIDYALTLGVSQIHVMSGVVPDGANRSDFEARYIANLKWAADEAGKHDITLLIEPLNPYDVPGYLVSAPADAARMIANSGAQNVFIQYDLYHQSRNGGEIIGTYRYFAPLIRHMQVAGNPGRHEPDTGEIDYRFVFRELERQGYNGWIGCEYSPAGRTEDGLGWFAGHR